MSFGVVLLMTRCSPEVLDGHLTKGQAFLTNLKGLFFDMRIFLIIISSLVRFLMPNLTLTREVPSYFCGKNTAFNSKYGPNMVPNPTLFYLLIE
ncbi:hypothetical protein Bcsk_004920 [Bartonella sp. CDC_skunk]|nr:hypothetical protein Bcsk_004920 [Bartonella sp. CDC_skunk]